MCTDEEPKSPLALGLVIAGSAVSVISIVNNVLLFVSLLRSARCFQCYFQFILFMCFFDIVISMCYMPVILVDSLKDWTKWTELARAWWPYFVYGLTLTHVAMTSASFILVAALYERYLITSRSVSLKPFQAKRNFLCFVCIFVGALTKGGIVIELDVFPNPDETCKGTVQELYVDITPITQTVWYGNVYRFWLRNIATIFLPFSLLTIINVKTLLALKSQMRDAIGSCSRRRFSIHAQSKSNVRRATWTLLLVCFVYLCSNVLNVIIAAWEFIDMKSLETRFLEEYMLSTDVASLLVVLACALRMPIYMVCNPELRRIVQRSFAYRPDHQVKLQQSFSLIAKLLV